MTGELAILLGGAVVVAAVHTLSGPDHYLPFVAIARARRWSLRRTAWVTVLCGLGHCASSVALGVAGLAAWTTMAQLEWVEEFRGEWAAWLLVAFGLAYATWGLWHGLRGRRHTHRHAHADGGQHDHAHDHRGEHGHVHERPGKSVAPWVLFVIFVFGPCEPMIPLVMKAATPWGILLVSLTFTAVTIATMLAAVLAATYGLKRVSLRPLARWGHALAGAVVCVCGLAMIYLGL